MTEKPGGGMTVDRSAPKRRTRRRRLAIVATICALAASLLLLAMVLPYWTSSHEFPVATAGPGTTIHVTVPSPGYVTVRFSQHNALSMSYWVRGPGAMGGAGSSTMGLGGATYSFWTWGGHYDVGAGMPVRSCGFGCLVPASGEVWANVTTGIL